jgi:hypothetical protein
LKEFVEEVEDQGGFNVLKRRGKQGRFIDVGGKRGGGVLWIFKIASCNWYRSKIKAAGQLS